LRHLADKAEMSASMLSQIETGKAYPSVRSLYGIAAALSLYLLWPLYSRSGDI